MKIKELPSLCTLYGTFAQARAQPNIVTLFQGWTRLTTDGDGEMQGAPLQGYYVADTQLISHYQIRLNNEPVSHRLSTQISSNEWATVGAILHSGDFGNLPKGTLPKGSIEVRIVRKIEQAWSERITIKNNGIPERKINLDLELCCPIRDTEFVEEMKTEKKYIKRGIAPKIHKEKNQIILQFEKCFGKRKKTPTPELNRVYGTEAPVEKSPVIRKLEIHIRVEGSESQAQPRIRVTSGNCVRFQAQSCLGSREELAFEIQYFATVDQTTLSAPPRTVVHPIPTSRPSLGRDVSQIQSSNSTLNLVVGQAMVDLRSLILPVFGLKDEDSSRFLALSAGVPRYIGLFGRDNLVTACQSALFGLDLFEPILSRLEVLQGIRRDDWRDEELDRMLHERRLGPRSEVGESNRELYYGDVTSTPFWILALSTLYQWTGSRDLLKRHKSTLDRCCRWILRRLKEGQGFIYYAPAISEEAGENRNQAWKDSGDAIVDEQGRICTPPLAIIEIQGYAYQAMLEAAQLFTILGDKKRTSLLRQSARELKVRFNRDFWVKETGAYALSLDQKRKQNASKASNVGHCFGTGILDIRRIPKVVKSLMSEDMFSGWGIRTLSSQNPGYDPFSYHRGAVWPVENAFIASGMANEGHHSEALELAAAQLGIAAAFQHMRLPEVLSGHTRSLEIPTPGVYSFGNLLQAWSVSAIAQYIQMILGIRPRADLGILFLDPHLPSWLDWLELKNLKVGEWSIDLHFWRDSKGKSHWRSLKLLRRGTGKPFERMSPAIQLKSGVPPAFYEVEERNQKGHYPRLRLVK